jgi:hypothetical protein
MAGLVPAIHDWCYINALKAWMAGTRPAMTRVAIPAFPRSANYIYVPGQRSDRATR